MEAQSLIFIDGLLGNHIFNIDTTKNTLGQLEAVYIFEKINNIRRVMQNTFIYGESAARTHASL